MDLVALLLSLWPGICGSGLGCLVFVFSVFLFGWWFALGLASLVPRGLLIVMRFRVGADGYYSVFRVWLLDLAYMVCSCVDWSCGILLSFVLLAGLVWFGFYLWFVMMHVF